MLSWLNDYFTSQNVLCMFSVQFDFALILDSFKLIRLGLTEMLSATTLHSDPELIECRSKFYWTQGHTFINYIRLVSICFHPSWVDYRLFLNTFCIFLPIFFRWILNETWAEAIMLSFFYNETGLLNLCFYIFAKCSLI